MINDPAAAPERRATALSGRAEAATRQGRYADAIADATQAIALVPTAENLYLQRAIAYRGAGQLAKALVDVDKAIELEPTYQFANYVRGALNVGLKNDRAAVADFTKAIELDRTHSEAWTERGGAKFRLGEKNAARADLVHALGLLPTYSTYLYLGLISGDGPATEQARQTAIDYFGRAIALNPRDRDAYHFRGEMYLRLLKPDEAIRDLTQAIDIFPTDFSYVGRATGFVLKSQFKEALADATKAIALNPRNAEAYHQRGIAYVGIGQTQKAISDFRMALSLDPTLSAARNNLVLLGVKP